MRRAFRLCPTWPTGFCTWATLEAACLLVASNLPTSPVGTYVQARRVYTRARVLARPHNLLIPLERWGSGEQSVGTRGVALPYLESGVGHVGLRLRRGSRGLLYVRCIAGALLSRCRCIAGVAVLSPCCHENRGV